LDDKLKEKCEKYCRHLSELLNIECVYIDIFEEARLSSLCNPNRFCSKCVYELKDELKTHLYGCREAYRWNGKYIYYCPIGLVFVTSSITDEKGNLLGGILQGPMIMGEINDTLHEMTYKSMHDHVATLPSLSPDQVTDLSEILYLVASQISGLFPSKEVSILYEQEKFLNTLYDVKEKYFNANDGYIYPIEAESNLRQLIIKGDKKGSQALLNEIMGHIFFLSSFDLGKIKTRVFELMVLLSRAAIEAGADIREIFSYSEGNIREIEKINSMEDLSVWVNGILNRFINCSFEFTQIKHADIIYKVMEYIRKNYSDKLSLDDIAKHVYLSKAYLSSIFKEEIGSSLTAYINKVRVDKSKLLLADGNISLVDVASLCGFEDQSYFTKVFRSITGISPKKYRDSHWQTNSK